MPDEKTFIFKECCELLKINPKSFLEWLRKAKIDPDAQVDKADPRKKFLTKSQLILLAESHGRDLPDWVYEETEQYAPMTVETLAEQLMTFHGEVMHQFNQIGAIVQEIAAKQHTAASALDAIQAFQQQIALRLDHLESYLQALPSQRSSILQEMTAPETDAQGAEQQALAQTAAAATKELPQSKNKTTSSPGNSKTTAKKKTAKGKRLPRHLVALRDFASQHSIATERASDAAKTNKIEVVRGKWLVNSRWAFEALTERGQQDFYHLFHDRQGFMACERCPHEAVKETVQDRSEAMVHAR